VKAQHFKQGDLSEAEYQALLQEADRIRAYQVANENYSGISHAATQGSVSASPVDTSYEIELFAEPVSAASYAETTPLTLYSAPAATTAHTVIKGDTLYNISKRYAVTINEIQTVNKTHGLNL